MIDRGSLQASSDYFWSISYHPFVDLSRLPSSSGAHFNTFSSLVAECSRTADAIAYGAVRVGLRNRFETMRSARMSSEMLVEFYANREDVSYQSSGLTTVPADHLELASRFIDAYLDIREALLHDIFGEKGI